MEQIYRSTALERHHTVPLPLPYGTCHPTAWRLDAEVRLRSCGSRRYRRPHSRHPDHGYHLLKDAAIDAFILNIDYGDSNGPTQVANAFAAADAAGSSFKLAFSFDCLGGSGGAWPATGDGLVAAYLNQYRSSHAYFQYDGGPFVSTFEGTGNVDDWAQGGAIRSAVGSLYSVPSWTSLGPGGITADLDSIEGFFSWDMGLPIALILLTCRGKRPRQGRVI